MSPTRQVLGGGIPESVAFEVEWDDGKWRATVLAGGPLRDDQILGFGETPVTALIDAEIKLRRKLPR